MLTDLLASREKIANVHNKELYRAIIMICLKQIQRDLLISVQ